MAFTLTTLAVVAKQRGSRRHPTMASVLWFNLNQPLDFTYMPSAMGLERVLDWASLWPSRTGVIVINGDGSTL